MAILIQKAVMQDSMILSKEEAMTYVGGAGTIKAAVVSAITSAAKFIYELGQNLGSTVRRLKTNTSC